MDEDVAFDIGGGRSNPLSVASKAAEASGKGSAKDGISTSLAHAALQSFPEERSEDDLDLIYQYLVHVRDATPPPCRVHTPPVSLQWTCACVGSRGCGWRWGWNPADVHGAPLCHG